jgi:hypothetical protein
MSKAAGFGVLDAQAVIIDARRHAGRQVAPVIPIAPWPATTARLPPWTPMTSC